MYTPLNIKTHNSLLSSMIKIDDLISYALKNNLKSLTITDTNMYGVVEFYKKCISNNIKPIIGLDVDGVILYCKNYEGYKDLIKINSSRKIDKKYSNLICIVKMKDYDKYKNLFDDIFISYSSLDEKKDLKGNLIYMSEILYLDNKDSIYLKYLKAIKEGTTIDKIEDDFERKGILDSKLYDDSNNSKIFEMCNVELKFNQKLIPKFDNSYEKLKELCKNGLKRLFNERVPKVYIDRLKYELDIINKMGFCDYFLIVEDYVRYAKENDILVGSGRGSAAGSLVSYLLNITTVDPIKYNLLFERFLNPERISMPDIDIDFMDTKRDEMVKYCIKKYGEKKVAPIITFGTLGSKGAIRDVGRVLNIDLKVIDNLSKLIDSKLSLIDNYKNNKVKDFLNQNNKLKEVYKIASKIEGLKRHTSIHAAGIVMCDVDLDEIIPIEKHDDIYITGYSMEYLEEIGLLKMDFLALENLTLINNILKEINLNFDEIPLNDSKTIDIFTNVNTIGIFQFESDGMMNFLRKFKPNCMEDLFAAIALFRPGPMGNIDSYIKRKKGLEKIDYFGLEEILKPTYGIIVYQEQIMLIANKMASYTLAEADLLRKAMSKKKEDIMLKEKDKFIKNSLKNGYSEETSNKIFELILKFASYGFNRAHSVSYSIIAYKMAYLKAHYPNIFMKHLLNNVIGSEIKTKKYIYEARNNNVNILKPDINNSGLEYSLEHNNIRFPLLGIKGIGSNIVNLIINNRPYNDIFDFIVKCKEINTKSLQSLIDVGCFDSFYNQKTIDMNLESIINYSEIGGLLSADLKPEIELFDEYDKSELMKKEYELLGFYLTNHPVSEYRNKYKITINSISNYYDKVIDIVVLVDFIKEINTKNNDKMLFITGSDELDKIDIVMFPKTYEKYNDIKKGEVLLINGKVEKRYDKYQVIVNEVKRV